MEKRKPIRDYFAAYQTEMKRLDLTDISERDKQLLRKFASKLESEGKRYAYIYSEVSRLKNFRLKLGKDFADATENDMRATITLMDRDLTPKSMLSYKTIIRTFWKFFKTRKPTIENPSLFPEEVSWIDMKMAMKRTREQATKPVLTEEEVYRLLQAAGRRKRQFNFWQRDRAFIFVHYEAMCRIGEDLNLIWSDIEWEKDANGNITSATITIPSLTKTGSRKVVIIESLGDLCKWKRLHPEGNNPNAYIWRNMSTNSDGSFMSYGKTVDMLKEIAKEAGIESEIHTHLFRSSRCTHLLVRGVPQETVRHQGGWAPNSQAFYLYSRFNLEDRKNNHKKLAGLENPDEKPYPFGVKKCKCGTLNSALDDQCYSCTYPLSKEIIKEIKKEQQSEIDVMKQEMETLRKQQMMLIKSIQNMEGVKPVVSAKPISSNSMTVLRRTIPMINEDGMKRIGVLDDPACDTHILAEFDRIPTTFQDSLNSMLKDFINQSISVVENATGKRVVDSTKMGNTIILIMEDGEKVPIHMAPESDYFDAGLVMGIEKK